MLLNNFNNNTKNENNISYSALNTFTFRDEDNMETIEKENLSNKYQIFSDNVLRLISDIYYLLNNFYNDKIDINEIFNKLETLTDIVKVSIENFYLQFINDEKIIRKYENDIRKFTRVIFELKIENKTLENKINFLNKKEEEYEKLKKLTHSYFDKKNNKFVINDRKENEIFILRGENSNLKKIIEKLENDVKNKNEEINNLKDKNDSLLHSNSNININFNDISHSNLYFNQNNNSQSSSNLLSSSNNNNIINSNNTQSSERAISRVKTYSKEPSIKNLYFEEINYSNRVNKNKNDLILTSQKKNNNNNNNNCKNQKNFYYNNSLIYTNSNNLKKHFIHSPTNDLIDNFTPINKKQKSFVSNKFHNISGTDLKKTQSNSNIIQNTKKSFFSKQNFIQKNKPNNKSFKNLFMNTKSMINNYLVYRNSNINNSNNNNLDNNDNNGFNSIRSIKERKNSSLIFGNYHF